MTLPDDLDHEARVACSDALNHLMALSCSLGTARALLDDPRFASIDEALATLQRHLFALDLDLAQSQGRDAHIPLARAPAVLMNALECFISDWRAAVELSRRFMLPGGAPPSAALHVARCEARRARCAIQKSSPEDALAPYLPYLERLEFGLLLCAQRLDALHDLAPTPWLAPDVTAFDGVRGAMALARALLLDRGEVISVGGKLYAGGQLLNGDTALVDAVKAETGYGCTIFQGNHRISTTATAEGEDQRALGTEANEMITQRVLGEGKTFQGVTRTIGKDWMILYVPLRVASGEIVGMIATYSELQELIA